MNITHIIFSFNTGGSETMLVDIINEQVKSKQVSLIIINDQINKKLLDKIDKRIKVVLIGRKEHGKNPIPIVKLNLYLFKLKPDVIHCHNHETIQILLFKGKAVLTVHDINIPSQNFKLYRRIFAISNAVKKDIELRSKIKAILIYNGVKLEEIKTKENYKFDMFRIVQVSRLDHWKKGQHILLEALKIIVYEENVKNIAIDFIGEGNSLGYLNGIVKDYYLEKHVNFLGLRDREYIYGHLKDYELLVQPSLYEGFGLTIVEGMAAKIPVLVSDIDGPIEIIENGKYGYYFESKNSAELASKIHYIYTNYNDLQVKQKIELAYDYVKSNFDIKITVEKYLANYKQQDQTQK